VILATAFNPFGAAETNASETLLRALKDNAGVVRVVLPTEYEGAAREVVRLIRELRPQAVICFGVAGSADVLRLERVARNRDGTAMPDNAGDLRNGQAIVPGAPDVYLATLPYEAMSAALEARGIPHVFSENAGGYVCNHAFFHARHEIAESGREIPCGFVHVPPIKGPREFAMLLEAMEICIDAAARATPFIPSRI
jgi:pyroglutamyl-peptidase